MSLASSPSFENFECDPVHPRRAPVRLQACGQSELFFGLVESPCKMRISPRSPCPKLMSRVLRNQVGQRFRAWASFPWRGVDSDQRKDRLRRLRIQGGSPFKCRDCFIPLQPGLIEIAFRQIGDEPVGDGRPNA